MNNSKFKIQNSEFSIFHPTYFPSIAQFVKMLQTNDIVFEIEDNFQKQTYRNRCYIFGANGKQLLNIPIQKVSGKEKSKNIKIDYSENWQQQHFKSLVSAYKSSPIFEFYIDDLQEIFLQKETLLIDLNIKTTTKIFELLPLDLKYTLTSVYDKEIKNDYRYMVNSKSTEEFNLPNYTQVFSNKHGFLENLSILDLLFNEGPTALLYLEKIIK